MSLLGLNSVQEQRGNVRRWASCSLSLPQRSEEQLSDSVDFAVITALGLERRAVCKAFGLGDAERVSIDSRAYWCGSLDLRDGRSYRLVVAQAPDMANVDAALLTNDTIHHWDPGVLFMVGIAASANDEIALGDIVLGKEVYYYERGKVTEQGRRLEPIVYRADSTIWAKVTAHTEWITPIPVERPDGTILRPRIHEGVIACGEKVIADNVMKNQLVAENRKILAIEMESYGFSAAVWRNSQMRRHLVIRGISDRGDRDKNDDWQKYAAAASAGFLKHCILDGSIPSRHRENTESASSMLGDRSHLNVSTAEMDVQTGDVGGQLDATNLEMDSATEPPARVSQKVVVGDILPGSRISLVNLRQSGIGPKKGKN